MEDLAAILDQLIAEKPHEQMSKEEAGVRSVVITALFAAKGMTDDQSEDLALRYVMGTDDIPFGVLVIAVKGLIRAHHYKGVPELGDIWKSAWHVAGMHRERYHAGRYLPPPTKWPPEGKRYGVCYGEFETLPAVSVKALSSPQRAAKYLGGG